MNYAAPVHDAYRTLLELGAEFRDETLRHGEMRPEQQVLDEDCGAGVR